MRIRGKDLPRTDLLIACKKPLGYLSSVTVKALKGKTAALHLGIALYFNAYVTVDLAVFVESEFYPAPAKIFLCGIYRGPSRLPSLRMHNAGLSATSNGRTPNGANWAVGST